MGFFKDLIGTVAPILIEPIVDTVTSIFGGKRWSAVEGSATLKRASDFERRQAQRLGKGVVKKKKKKKVVRRRRRRSR